MRGLADVGAEQRQAFHLSRLSIQLLDDRLQATLAAKQGLEANMTAASLDPENEIVAKDLLARLDAHSEQLVSELHRRQPAAEDAHRRILQTEDFVEELRQASNAQLHRLHRAKDGSNGYGH